jgi:hypothetical protein
MAPDGVVLVDDSGACRAFDEILPGLPRATAFAAPHAMKSDAVGIVVRSPS